MKWLLIIVTAQISAGQDPQHIIASSPYNPRLMYNSLAECKAAEGPSLYGDTRQMPSMTVCLAVDMKKTELFDSTGYFDSHR